MAATPHANSVNLRKCASRSWRAWLGWLIIAAASATALFFHFRRDSPIHPTPVYQRTGYQMHALVNGRPLTREGTVARYRLPISGISTLSPEGLKTIVRHRESSDYSGDQVYVRLHVRENGGSEVIWLWPEH